MRTTLRWCVAALVCLAPLPFGSVQPWAVLMLQCAAGLLGLTALVLVLRDPTGAPPKLIRLAGAAGAVLAVGVLQLLPLPGMLVELLAGRTVELRGAVESASGYTDAGWRPLSLAPPETVDAVLRFGAYTLIALAAAVALRRPRHLFALALAVSAAAVFQAVYGAAEYLSGRQHIFLYAKRHYLDSATGTFVNRNHFGAFLALTLPMLLVVLARVGRRPSGALRHVWTAGLGIAVCAVLAGLFLSYSRGALLAAVVGVVTLLVLRGISRRAVLPAGIALVATAGLLAAQELRPPGARLLPGYAERVSSQARLDAWNAGRGMVRQYPLLGTGLGTFEAAFPAFQPAHLEKRFTHVHNDWLEACIEGGVTTLLLMIALLVAALAGLPVRHPDARARGVAAACAAGLLALAAHSVVDFPLRIPAVALTAAVLVGALASPAARRVTHWPDGSPR